MHAFIFWGFLVLLPTIVEAMLAVDRPPLDAPLPRPRGLVRVPPGPLRDPRGPRRRDRVHDPQGPAAGPVPWLAHGGGRPDPARDPRDRHDVVAVEREPDRARVRGSSRRRAGRRRALRPVRWRPRHRGGRARPGVVTPADRPGVPHLPAAVEAPAHHHGGPERLSREEPTSRLPRAAPDRPRGSGCGRAARRVGRDRPVTQAGAGSLLVHGVRSLPGGLPGVGHGQAALAEAADHGSPRPGGERSPADHRGRRGDRRAAAPGPERGRRSGGLGLRDVRRVRPRCPVDIEHVDTIVDLAGTS